MKETVIPIIIRAIWTESKNLEKGLNELEIWVRIETIQTAKQLKGEPFLIAAENNGISTNNIKARIDRTQQNSRCWLWGDWDKTIDHIINEYNKFAQKGYKTRYD